MRSQRAERTAEASHGLVAELLVEVFLRRGAAHHGDVGEAAAEFRELFARFGILSPENEALIERKVARLRSREGSARLRLVGNEAADERDG